MKGCISARLTLTFAVVDATFILLLRPIRPKEEPSPEVIGMTLITNVRPRDLASVHKKQVRSLRLIFCSLFLLIGLSVSSAQPAPLSPPELDHLVARIALYPDPLLAQTLTASTFWDVIPEAAIWAEQHSYLNGDALARAIQDDRLPWDPSLLGLLPFPSALDMMAHDPAWTQRLGNAVLTQRPEVMDAVQRMRQQARRFGYLVPNHFINVVTIGGGYIEILPLNPGVLYVPYYNPLIVFAPPAPGFAIATAVRFGPAIPIGTTFVSWGWWTGPGFFWPSHIIVVGGHPWIRTWATRRLYVHPYPHPWIYPVRPRVETHRFRR
jgi:hypothetical protein